MSYPPPGDINFQILTKNCSDHHVFCVCRPQNYDEIIIFDPSGRGGAKIWGLLFFFDILHHENVIDHNIVDFC